MSSNRIKLLVVGIMVFGVTAQAYACGDDNKAKGTSASYSSSEKSGADCCASKSANAKMTKAECAAKMTKAECSAKMSSASVVATSEHCSGASQASKVAAACTYGENSVTMASSMPTKNEADYAFYVSGAECQGTGTSVAKTVKSVKGVAAVTVDYDKHMVYVCADGKTASKQAIEKSLKTAGYDDVKFVSVSKQNCSKSHGKIEA